MRQVLVSVVAFLAVVIGGESALVRAGEFSMLALQSTVSVLPRRTEALSNESRPEEPEGTGVAVFDGSYIATAAHVLSGAEQVYVRLSDGHVFLARIVGRDAATDIALLGISTSIPPFVLSDDVALGAPVCSVGNQFGLGLSVTCGVISALHRSNAGFNPVEDFIQTDAVVNPGASGGALVDGGGRLVGMLSGIFTKGSDANIGVNFAVHASLLRRVLSDLKDHGRVRPVTSGMVVRALELAERETQTGVRVVRVAPDSAAWRAGLRPDDVIVTIESRKILHPGDVSGVFYAHRPGDLLPLEIVRGGQQRRIDLIF